MSLFLRHAAKRMLFFDIKCKTGAFSALAGEIVLPDHFHRLRIDHRDGVLIFEVNVDLASAVGLGLFRRATQINGAENGAVLIVDDGDVRRAMREFVEAMVKGVVEVAIGIAFDVDLLDNGEGLRIEHCDRLRRGEAMPSRGIDDCSVRADVRYIAHLLEGVQRIDANVSVRAAAACHVQVAAR